MRNPLNTYILNIYDLVWLAFNGISTIVGYLMPDPLYTYIYMYQIYMTWFYRVLMAF